MSLIRPYKATVFDSLGIVQFVVGSAITPDNTWTKLPGTTHINRASGGEFASAAAWRITDVLGGWGFYRVVATVQSSTVASAAPLIEYGFGISAAGSPVDPTGVFVSQRDYVAAGEGGIALGTFVLESWLQVPAGQFVEPYARIPAAVSNTMQPLVGTFSASRGHNEP